MFCGNRGQMTKEHAWPQWLGRRIPVEPVQYSYNSGFARTSETALTELANESVVKQGSVLTSRIREVCATCNNGWMSRLEEEVRPHLEKLWAPGYPLGLTVLDEEAVATTAAWATKTAWVRERAAQHENTADSATRLHLATTLTVPPLTAVWAARHNGELNFAAFTAAVEVSHQDQHWKLGERREVMLCCLVFRNLAVLVRTDSGTGVPPMQLPGERWRQLAPSQGSVLWPPSRPISDEEATLVAKVLSGWLKMPEASEFNRSPGWRYRRQN